MTFAIPEDKPLPLKQFAVLDAIIEIAAGDVQAWVDEPTVIRRVTAQCGPLGGTLSWMKEKGLIQRGSGPTLSRPHPNEWQSGRGIVRPTHEGSIEHLFWLAELKPQIAQGVAA